MSEFTVGSWNMLNAAGDPKRQEVALNVVDAMNADVLYLCEMAENTSAERDAAQTFQADMKKLGYDYGTVTDYSPYSNVRNAHLMSLWSRGSVAAPVQFGVYGEERYAMKVVNKEEGIAVYGIHGDDISERKRIKTAETIVAENKHSGLAGVVMGDFNAMHRRDNRSRIPRVVGKLIGNLEVDYYYHSKKFQRQAGKIIRLARMANGSTMATYEAAGFIDTDKDLQPTIHMSGLAMNIDHIMVGQGIVANGFQRHDVPLVDGVKLSDHRPITAKLRAA